MALTRTVGFLGIWLLIPASGLMYVMRHSAGTMAHKFSPDGLLWISCLLASSSLLLLSVAQFACDRIAGGDGLGHRHVLHVAHHADLGGGTIPTRRRAGRSV